MGVKLVESTNASQPGLVKRYVDDSGKEYSSYAEYYTAQQDNYYIKFKQTAEQKEQIYRRFQGLLSTSAGLKRSLFARLQGSPDDIDLKRKYSDVCKDNSDKEINEHCAWWSWAEAVDSQRSAIIV